MQSPTHLDRLNVPQSEATQYLDGPLLVLAGAGTGKTRVLISRIAHIVSEGRAYLSQVLAVTFTNKASSEMKHRLESMVGHSAEGLWLGTFHSICVRILRRHGEKVGLQANFTILDSDDQLRLIKQIMKSHNLDEKSLPPRLVLARISRFKDRALSPDKVQSGGCKDRDDGTVLMVYRDYQERLGILNAIDFGDILLKCVDLFQNFPDVLAGYHAQFRYILVDEYQDTNVAQYLWLRLLAMGPNTNLCCVGDDDQSIYGWRGAEVTNILRFDKDFPGAKIVRLEQNYRSTHHILGAAGGLITHNESRLGKTLWTDDDSGDKVIIRHVWDGEDEARVVGDEIETMQRRGEPLNHAAILVRASFQTREFEDRFITLGLPYKVIGGMRFYERQEIRDAMAYMRLIVQDDDSLAFERIINVPKRGLGAATLQVIHKTARAQNISMVAATRMLVETDELKGAARKTLITFLRDLETWRRLMHQLDAKTFLGRVLDESGYTNMWRQDKSADSAGRLENLKELVSALSDFDNIPTFLEHVSLVLDTTTNTTSEMVTIMTLHSAKGLEFKTVFLAGWEEGLFPNPRSIDENGITALEEERRLAYVGITRAEKRVIITHAASRRIHGTWHHNVPSRFLAEIPDEHVERHSQTGAIRPHHHQVSGRQSISGGNFSQTAPSLSPSIAQKSPRFKVGDRVFHTKFGYGRIKDTQGDKLDVFFDHSGLKKVIASFIEPAS